MNEVVSNINALIEAAAKLGNIALYGVADPIVIRDDSESIYPVIINNEGECHDVLFDDSKDLSLYHRLQSKSYNTTVVAGYGDDPQRSVVYDMSMIVCGKRSSINTYEMEQLCVSAIEGATNAKYRVKCEAVNTNFNRMQVFISEYTGVQFPIQPNIFLFKISYKITRVKSPCKN